VEAARLFVFICGRVVCLVVIAAIRVLLSCEDGRFPAMHDLQFSQGTAFPYLRTLCLTLTLNYVPPPNPRRDSAVQPAEGDGNAGAKRKVETAPKAKGKGGGKARGKTRGKTKGKGNGKGKDKGKSRLPPLDIDALMSRWEGLPRASCGPGGCRGRSGHHVRRLPL